MYKYQKQTTSRVNIHKIANNLKKSESVATDLQNKLDSVKSLLSDHNPLYRDIQRISDIYNPNFEQFIQNGGTLGEFEEELSEFKKK